MGPELSTRFPRYTQFDPLAPVWRVSSGRTIHRFFDTSPISPSGRYLGVTRLPFEHRLPEPGDAAEVVVVDFQSGEERVVADTRGWDTQLGAQVQWGPSDHQLFFNDVDVREWRPFGVKMDPLSGKRMNLEGTVYMVSPDERSAASPCLLRTGTTQAGYGVIVPPDRVPVNRGVSAEDGIFLTDTTTGRCRLLASYKQIFETARPPLAPTECEGGDIYGFHVKWNPQGDRLMFVLRLLPHDKSQKMRHNLVTMKPDGTDIRVAMPASEWTGKGGHHPNWCPDGEHMMMNLRIHGDRMLLVKARYDGTGCAAMTESVLGSGHPSLHPNGRSVVTDAYPTEPVAFGDGTTPIRLIDVAAGMERTVARIQVVPPFSGPKKELRVDPHPAWDGSFKRVAFNACPDGTRSVFLADLSGLLQ